MEGYSYEAAGGARKNARKPIIADDENVGITQRSIKELFEQIKNAKENEGKHISVFCSFLQIYNEKVYDLLNLNTLNPKKNTQGLRIRWNKKD
jgi:hypothetical protein